MCTCVCNVWREGAFCPTVLLITAQFFPDELAVLFSPQSLDFFRFPRHAPKIETRHKCPIEAAGESWRGSLYSAFYSWGGGLFAQISSPVR